ncbi:hypothetical protein BD410DRAFT_280844 [Rickenella mellea]|uniref:Uncharacterized protein n=1 Tax=Rickenella mellea TaxID=50990 RepID=A0A4Y7Q3V5_9AGAM|nr:hypothetical protein BD410DRAFT_280844 [Rickenella mellea]
MSPQITVTIQIPPLHSTTIISTDVAHYSKFSEMQPILPLLKNLCDFDMRTEKAKDEARLEYFEQLEKEVAELDTFEDTAYAIYKEREAEFEKLAKELAELESSESLEMGNNIKSELRFTLNNIVDNGFDYHSAPTTNSTDTSHARPYIDNEEECSTKRAKLGDEEEAPLAVIPSAAEK